MTLTDEQKEECQKILNALIDHLWSKVVIKMEIENKEFNVALEEIKQEMLND